MEQELREKAISRYLQGEAPKAIYTDLQRSKYWFFKWLKRYQSGELDWFRDKSRAALHRPTQIGEAEKQRIVSVRARLESERFAQIGASAIKWELSKSGHDFPSDRTINRVLKNEGLIKKTPNVPKGVEYPYFTEALDINNIPQKRTQKQLIGFLYQEEILKTFDSVDPRKTQGVRDYTLLHLLDDSGARASEVAMLKVDYFDAQQRTLAILGKADRYRQIKLRPKTAQLIELYIRNTVLTPNLCIKIVSLSINGEKD